MEPASTSTSPIRLPTSALEELDQVERMEWSLELEELLDWVNTVIAHYGPDWEVEPGGRVSPTFTIRTFRHYQTLGCIDSPERVGKKVHYGFRHFLQALLIRKLLYQRLPAEHILSLLQSRTNAEYKELLLAGIEIVPGTRASTTLAAKTEPALWRRLTIAPGLEIHLHESLQKPTESLLQSWIREFESVLRTHV